MLCHTNDFLFIELTDFSLHHSKKTYPRMKTALVIGASRGIGRQIAKTFAENGYKVCVAAKTVESSKKTPGKLCLLKI